MSLSARQVQLRRRPNGRVSACDFQIADVDLPELREGEVRVCNTWMSLDPYMRLGLTDQQGYLAATQPGDVMSGAAIGVVEASREPSLPVGAHVSSQSGWRSHFIAPGGALAPVDAAIPGNMHLGLLGLTGLTAFIGIEEVLQPTAGETIFISGVAGAVGAIACQLAKRRGARVLGSTGSAAKARWLREEIGIDAVVNHREQPLDRFLSAEAADGLDCCFDNVGGPMLDASLAAMKPRGRVGLCGAMSQYESGDYRSGPRNFFAIIEKSLAVHGFNAFLVTPDRATEIATELLALLKSEDIQAAETIETGLDRVPEAFANLLAGHYQGKLIVRL